MDVILFILLIVFLVLSIYGITVYFNSSLSERPKETPIPSESEQTVTISFEDMIKSYPGIYTVEKQNEATTLLKLKSKYIPTQTTESCAPGYKRQGIECVLDFDSKTNSPNAPIGMTLYTSYFDNESQLFIMDFRN